jgi:hypothetical protein
MGCYFYDIDLPKHCRKDRTKADGCLRYPPSQEAPQGKKTNDTVTGLCLFTDAVLQELLGGRKKLDQYMSSMPPPGGIAGFFFSSGCSAMVAWVVSNSPATEEAFCNENRTTFVGSKIPAARRFSKVSDCSLIPKSSLPPITVLSTTKPS